MPPPPSPPHQVGSHDAISRQGSLDRGGRRRSSVEREQTTKEVHMQVSVPDARDS